MKARKRMFLEIKPDVFLNTDKVAMIATDRDDNSLAIYGHINGTDCNFFRYVDVNRIIEQLRGTGNGRTENN
jgi:hypothetical protein